MSMRKQSTTQGGQSENVTVQLTTLNMMKSSLQILKNNYTFRKVNFLSRLSVRAVVSELQKIDIRQTTRMYRMKPKTASPNRFLSVPSLKVFRQALKKGASKRVQHRTLIQDVRVPRKSKSMFYLVMFYFGSVPASFMTMRMVQRRVRMVPKITVKAVEMQTLGSAQRVIFQTQDL